MEPLFQNKYTRTKKDYRAFYLYIYFRTAIFVAVDILMLLLTAVVVLNGILNEVWSFEFFIVLLFYELLRPFCVWHHTKLGHKRDMEQGGESGVESTVNFSENAIALDSSVGTHYDIPYSQIKRVYSAKNHFFLRSSSSFVYIIRKDSFTVGDPASFAEFLHKKGFRVKK